MSCTFTSIKPKKPDYITDSDTIVANIKRLIITQEIILTGSESKTEGQSTSELAITLINAENPPKDQNQYKELGERIAQLLKQALKDPNEYDIYKVVFLFEQTKGAVTNSKSAEFSQVSFNGLQQNFAKSGLDVEQQLCATIIFFKDAVLLNDCMIGRIYPGFINYNHSRAQRNII